MTELSSTLPDRQSLFDLFETTGWNQEYLLTSEEFYSAIEKSLFVVSAYVDRRLAGFGRVVSDGILHGMIYEMIVHPEYQCRGIGSSILADLLERCREQGIRELQLFCASGKEAFYSRHGFKRRPEDSPGMGMTLR